MTLSEALGQIKTIFLDTAPLIYFIEGHQQFGPLVTQVIALMNDSRASSIYIGSNPVRGLAKTGRVGQ